VLNAAIPYPEFVLFQGICQVYYFLAGGKGFVSCAGSSFILNRAWRCQSPVLTFSCLQQFQAIQVARLAVHSPVQWRATAVFGNFKNLAQLSSIARSTYFYCFLVATFGFADITEAKN
jgi:hypothetical protein